ncbi:MAG: ROK family protein [Balneolaceae bacterium]
MNTIFKKMDVIAGIDLGGTYTKFGLVNKKGDLLVDDFIKTDTEQSYQDFFKNLCDRIMLLKNEVDEPVVIKGIGLGAPSANFITGDIESASNLSWSETIPVTKLLQSYTKLPVTISNDANAAAMGEMMFGAAKGVENFISITLGTGLGSGIVVNGKLVTGVTGHAGEMGHILAVENGRLCACGKLGCLETYVSAPGILKTVDKLLSSRDTDSELRQMNEISPIAITEAAQKGDLVALEVFDQTGKIFGRRLADTVAILNPELIVLSGGLAKSGDLILEPTKKYMEESLVSIYRGTVEMKISEMSKKNAALLGAAAFMWQKLETLSPEFS